jgi:hypothetical protein
MAELITMYPGQVNSPTTVTMGALAVDTNTVTVLNGDVLPIPPNLLVLGGETSGPETVRMTERNGDTITIVRGVQAAAKAWPAGTTIARNFTAADYDAMRKNILTVNNDLLTTDGGDWDETAEEAAVRIHNANPYAHEDLEIDGAIGETLAEHNNDPSSHPGLDADGGKV